MNELCLLDNILQNVVCDSTYLLDSFVDILNNSSQASFSNGTFISNQHLVISGNSFETAKSLLNELINFPNRNKFHIVTWIFDQMLETYPKLKQTKSHNALINTIADLSTVR